MGSLSKKQAFFDVLKRLETTKRRQPYIGLPSLVCSTLGIHAEPFFVDCVRIVFGHRLCRKDYSTLLLAPVGAEHALVAAVAPFGVVFGGFEEVSGFSWELLHH